MPRFALAPVAALLLLAAGCSPPPARSANPTRPVPERRALEIIARAARKARLTPTEGRDVSLQTGGKIHADALLEPRKWAVAYLTASDQSAAAEALPKKDPDHPSALVVADGSRADAGMHILVLFERDYLYDDQVGEEHEQTMITAENAIERDVTDFLVQAKARQWE